jgi:putative SOS response-associated peptidase YedK
MDTFALVTTKSNELMRKVHNSKLRQPCILTKELAEEWISPRLSEERITVIAGHQYYAGLMIAHPVAKDFMTASEPQLAVEYDDLPAL